MAAFQGYIDFKIVVATGAPYQPTEVINVETEDSQCNNLPNWPHNINRAIGGLLDGHAIMICGGVASGGVEQDKYNNNKQNTRKQAHIIYM